MSAYALPGVFPPLFPVTNSAWSSYGVNASISRSESADAFLIPCSNKHQQQVASDHNETIIKVRKGKVDGVRMIEMITSSTKSESAAANTTRKTTSRRRRRSSSDQSSATNNFESTMLFELMVSSSNDCSNAVLITRSMQEIRTLHNTLCSVDDNDCGYGDGTDSIPDLPCKVHCNDVSFMALSAQIQRYTPALQLWFNDILQSRALSKLPPALQIFLSDPPQSVCSDEPEERRNIGFSRKHELGRRRSVSSSSTSSLSIRLASIHEEETDDDDDLTSSTCTNSSSMGGVENVVVVEMKTNHHEYERQQLFHSQQQHQETALIKGVPTEFHQIPCWLAYE